MTQTRHGRSPENVKAIVTCGPSYEPIDQARRITNFSTGRLGITLANALAREGWDVTCFKGEQAACAEPLQVRTVHSFSTNQDLADRLEKMSRAGRVDAILHTAALCDFQVERVVNERGEELASPKFSSREGRLQLILRPAIKVLPRLRNWFPNARIIGWKYELAGSQAEALESAWQQLRDSHSDACVLNGMAYGPGFALCAPDRSIKHFADGAALTSGLAQWLRNERAALHS